MGWILSQCIVLDVLVEHFIWTSSSPWFAQLFWFGPDLHVVVLVCSSLLHTIQVDTISIRWVTKSVGCITMMYHFLDFIGQANSEMMPSWAEKCPSFQVQQELWVQREMLKEEGQELLILLHGMLEIPLALMLILQRCERNVFLVSFESFQVCLTEHKVLFDSRKSPCVVGKAWNPIKKIWSSQEMFNPLTPRVFCQKHTFLDILGIFRLDLGQISSNLPKKAFATWQPAYLSRMRVNEVVVVVLSFA